MALRDSLIEQHRIAACDSGPLHFSAAMRFARAIEAEVRKDYEALILRLADALDECAEDSATVVNDYVQAYGENHRPLRLKALRDTVREAKEALAAARTRLEKAP